MTKKQTIFSAIQPSGELHIGNYLGALKNFVELQDKYNCFFFIADYHSITGDYNPKEKSKQIFDLTLDFLAAGLNPQKCTIAIQSQIPEHTELAWIFNTITPVSELQRMTQFKDKSQNQEKNINMGLFNYPVLQAADILMYKADAVPVGQDQIQHIELTRKIARLFNNKFGNTFPEPKDIITKTPKIMSLSDPTKKMSKSYGPKSYIGINDKPEIIKKKMRKAVSTTEYNKDIYNFYATLLKEFGSDKNKKNFLEQFKDQNIKFSELKNALTEDISNYFENFRKKREEFEKDPEKVKRILNEGSKKAKVIAQETIKEVKKKLGLVSMV
ncbi:MAG: tryptophan--tRNA ligase [Patescibacteria group bacterium]|nr:tryptophan--tRNA ligase [Patescibacteria group bacterium]